MKLFLALFTFLYPVRLLNSAQQSNFIFLASGSSTDDKNSKAHGPCHFVLRLFALLCLLFSFQSSVVGAGTSGDLIQTIIGPTDLGIANVDSVSAGWAHTMYVKADGTLWGMGWNYYGQLGDGTTTDRPSPVQIATNVASVSTGEYYTMFVKNDGTLWGMGSNWLGQLGDGTTTDRQSPVQIATNVASVSAGGRHTMFVKNDDTLWGMGSNSSGQLGDGTTTDRQSPVQIATNVASVSAGGGFLIISHTMFVKNDGTLWGMGNNSSGQLGDGTTTDRPSPVQIATNVASVSAGGGEGAMTDGHTMFVKNDDTLWGMGSNANGRLGDGTTTDRPSPVQIATNVASVSAGEKCTIFIKTDNTLWGTGYNPLANLGTLDFVDRLIPSQFDYQVI